MLMKTILPDHHSIDDLLEKDLSESELQNDVRLTTQTIRSTVQRIRARIVNVLLSPLAPASSIAAIGFLLIEKNLLARECTWQVIVIYVMTVVYRILSIEQRHKRHLQALENAFFPLNYLLVSSETDRLRVQSVLTETSYDVRDMLEEREERESRSLDDDIFLSSWNEKDFMESR